MLDYKKITHPEMIVAEIRMLHWICDHTKRYRIRNDDIRDKLGVTLIQEKSVQHRLRWFGYPMKAS
jgi:hypothetical protein